MQSTLHCGKAAPARKATSPCARRSKCVVGQRLVPLGLRAGGRVAPHLNDACQRRPQPEPTLPQRANQPEQLAPLRPQLHHHHHHHHQQQEERPQPHSPGGGMARADRRAALRGLALGLGLGLGASLGLGVAELECGSMRALAAEGVTTVFVAGATGKTGRRVVQQLRQAGFAVRAGVRSSSKALALGLGADPGVTIVEADVTKGADVLVSAIGNAQAVVCATGAAGFGPNGAAAVDEQGTKALVDAALRAGASKFVLVSSLLTNGAAAGQGTNPNYLFLNLIGGVLDCKLKAENYLRTSGLDYTIIRPGGLSNEPESELGNLIVSREDSLFARESDPGRVISRDTVAAVAVQALLQPEASRNKVLEVVSSPAAPCLPPEQWFTGV